MSAYPEPLRQALILFPTICILFTVPLRRLELS